MYHDGCCDVSEAEGFNAVYDFYDGVEVVALFDE